MSNSDYKKNAEMCVHRTRVRDLLRGTGFTDRQLPGMDYTETIDLVEKLVLSGQARRGVFCKITLADAEQIIGDSYFDAWDVIDDATKRVLLSNQGKPNAIWELSALVSTSVEETGDTDPSPHADRIVNLVVH